MLARLSILLLLSLCQVSTFQVYAQTSENTGKDSKFLFKNPNRRSISIEFELINNLIVLPVVINDSDTLHFILDSGFNSIMVSDLGYHSSITINQNRRVQLVGLGEGEPIQAYHSQGNELYISGIVGQNQEVFVLIEDIFHLSSIMGKEINGILGHGFFRDFIVEINYGQKRLTFHDPSNYRYRKRRNATVLPLIIKQNKSYIQAEIKQENNTIIPTLLVIDTGGSHALWLDVHTNDLIIVPGNNFSTLLGTGLNGPIYGKKGRVNQLKLGNIVFENVLGSFPDSISISHALGLDGRLGSLGAEVLSRFNIIFDYQGGTITLKPNKYFKQDFIYNPSGIEVSNPIPGLPYFIISNVREGSGAYKAGIKIGDEIVSIQGTSVLKLSLNDIFIILRGKPGKKIRMLIKSQQQLIPVEFELERLL